jgi:hypothetical protein
MKKYISLFALSLTVIAFSTSCSSPEESASEFIIESTHFTRSGQAQEMTINFQGQSITLNAADILEMQQMNEAESAEAQELMDFHQSFMGAEKEAQLLDVNFIMSDEPVENGVFIFGIETENAKDLTIEMFDEEGYGMVANNKFDINEGSNYKALNVNSMESGDYVFRIKDDQGKELERTVSIDHKE